MPSLLRHGLDKAHVHAVLCKLIAQHLRRTAQKPGVPNVIAGFCSRDGLVQSLSAAIHHKAFCGLRFAGAQECVHGIDIIDIERAKVQNAHEKLLCMIDSGRFFLYADNSRELF